MIFGNFSSLNCSKALTSSGTRREAASRTSAARRQLA
jgi:hypothetical protein